jgi:hypothetical protein
MLLSKFKLFKTATVCLVSLMASNCFASTYDFNDGGFYFRTGVRYNHQTQGIAVDTNEFSALLREVEIVGDKMIFRLSTTATMYENNWNAATSRFDKGNVLDDSIGLEFNLTLSGVTATVNPNGFFALVSTGATTVSGGVTLTGGDFNGDGLANDILTVDGIKAMPMNFFNADPNSYKYVLKDVGTFLGAVAEIQGLGDGFSAINWVEGAYRNNIFVNGVASELYGKFQGDTQFTNSVPEPATMALLGCGMLGGAIRRKRASAI